MKKHNLKQAFTLVELIVVIGIIGILAGVLFASFGGATDSARSAECMANMKSLSSAVNAYAMQTGWYPLAGSREAVDVKAENNKAKTVYTPQRGWISWLDKGKYEDPDGNAVANSHQSPSLCSYDGSGSDEENRYAITNGTIWKLTGMNRKIYTCPIHRQRNPKALWSYVMNSKFGHDYSRGSRAVATEDSRGIWFNSLKRSDRVLLFAELPFIDAETGSDSDETQGEAGDCTLQFKASVGGKNYPKDSTWGCKADWNGNAESIGCPHREKKGGYFGHVAFADGHVEKIRYNTKGLSMDKVTALLCEGLDIAFSPGKGYQQPNNSDEM